MILLVTYDLKGRPGTYRPLFDVLKSEQGWSHYMRSTWLVSTDKSPQQFFDILRPHIQVGDRMLVSRLSSDRQGWLPRTAWDWIKRHTS
jgi:hypothetical protein